jgi:hypothetical protein
MAQKVVLPMMTMIYANTGYLRIFLKRKETAFPDIGIKL